VAGTKIKKVDLRLHIFLCLVLPVGTDDNLGVASLCSNFSCGLLYGSIFMLEPVLINIKFFDFSTVLNCNTRAWSSKNTIQPMDLGMDSLINSLCELRKCSRYFLIQRFPLNLSYLMSWKLGLYKSMTNKSNFYNSPKSVRRELQGKHR